MISSPTVRASAILAVVGVLPHSAVGQDSASVPSCYAVRYDSIDAGLERQALAFSLKFRPGSARGGLTTEDTTPVWRIGTGNSYWWRKHDSVHVMLSNGQFELWLDLAAIGDTLRGVVTYRTDVEPRRPPRARVVAVRTPCKRA